MSQQQQRDFVRELVKIADKIEVFQNAASFTGWSVLTHDGGSAFPASAVEVALYQRVMELEKKLQELAGESV